MYDRTGEDIRAEYRPLMRMVCHARQERSGTWCREPKMGLGRAGHTSDPKPLSAGMPRRPFPAFPHAKI